MSTCSLVISVGLIVGNFVQIKITQEKAKHSALFPFLKADEPLLKRLSKIKAHQLEMIKYYACHLSARVPCPPPQLSPTLSSYLHTLIGWIPS